MRHGHSANIVTKIRDIHGKSGAVGVPRGRTRFQLAAVNRLSLK